MRWYQECAGDGRTEPRVPEMTLSRHIERIARSGLWRAFAGRRGGGAVEFAIVAPIFLLFIFMIIETGLILFTQATLDNATRDASRLVLTGQAQQGAGASVFTTQLCADVSPLISCSSLAYNVQNASSFGAMSANITTDSSGNMTPNANFSPGGSGGDTLIQVAYNRTFLVYWVGSLVSSRNSLLLVSTVALQVEPY